jgi:hypothetical protein
MPCPFFFPQSVLDSGGWDPAPRLPLIDAWSGECHAPGAVPGFAPPEEHQWELCNLGYARGACPHFPVSSDAPDAVRFTVLRPIAEPAESRAESPERLFYILERDHTPVEHGSLGLREYATDLDLDRSARVPLAPIRVAQARAFLHSLQTRVLKPQA